MAYRLQYVSNSTGWVWARRRITFVNFVGAASAIVEPHTARSPEMPMNARADGRSADQLRPVEVHSPYLSNPAGSVLWSQGRTRIVCAVSCARGVPRWLRGSGSGWLTAEYGMLPQATSERTAREARRGQSGRSQEIQRLIGRSLRAAMDLSVLGENTITVDCDVLDADGGTRTAAICGSFVALRQAVAALRRTGVLKTDPIHGWVTAVSVGMVAGEAVLDLDYAEDAQAEVDLNVVMNDAGGLIEIQGTAEGHAFRRGELERMLDLAEAGCRQLRAVQEG